MEQGRDAWGSTEASFMTDYKLMMTLGSRNFSQVKLAVHVPTLTCVAVKVLRNKNSSLVANEVNIMKSLEHANIIKLFHVVQSRSSTYLVMEHASKGDLLHHILELGSLQESEARRLFTQVLSAVQYCHNHNIALRDIKANHILLDCRGEAKLCDFGHAAEMPPGGRLKDFCGTLLYCAPELFGDEAYDGRASDIWSLGVLLFLMVAGRFPFWSTSSDGLRRQILAANFTIPQHISIDMFNVIVELLMINPSRRPTIDQIMRRPLFRDRKTHSTSPCTQSLPGTPSPSIVRTMTFMGYKSEEIINSLRDQTYNQVMATYLILQNRSLGGDCCHRQVKPYPVPLRRATENAPPICTLPSLPQEKEGEKKDRHRVTRHSMPANLCYQAAETHLPHRVYLERHRTLCLMCSNEEMSDSSSEGKIESSVSLMASVHPSLLMCPASSRICDLDTTYVTYTTSSCSAQGELWSSMKTAQSVTSRGSSFGDPMQVDTITQEEGITDKVNIGQGNAMNEEVLTTQETTVTQEEAFREEGTSTQEEKITEEVTLTQEEASTVENTIIQEETITQEEASTEEGAIILEEAITEEKIITQEEASTEKNTITQEEAITEGKTITQEEASTEEGSITQEEASTEEGTRTLEEAIAEEVALAQEEAITKEKTLADGVTMNPVEAVTKVDAIMEHEEINQVAAFSLEVPMTQESAMTLHDIITQEEHITSGQPEDASPDSSQNRRCPKWKRVKKTIVNCLTHLCCCLPSAKRSRDSSKILAPKTQDPGVTPRTSPEEVEPQLHGL